MLWKEITSGAFAEAVGACDGLCLLPWGCIERHSAHLPLGTDQLNVSALARAAADEEPAVVFPPYYFGQIAEARHYPGTVALPHDLLLTLLRATVEEIARNGLDRILIVNGHGGNGSMLRFFLCSLLGERRDYVVYATNTYEMEEEARQGWREMRDSDHGGHADEMETSVMLHLRPELAVMDAVPEPEDGLPRGHIDHLPQLDTPVNWYADYPTHYAGDARSATPEKGEFVFRASVAKLVRQMRAIKADQVTPELLREFYGRSGRHSPGDGPGSS